ncbi:DNA segregation ATPase FtsK/SpoIIIE and related proteins [Shigella sonnei]|nr:DNA segregation ATPase FtsK/SpoIIIE and related proteins [Shigella sonnei]CSQ65816.1 DNA segregation ATPase FtsK/SpoIIIE and related proteins [Shigella sonnei]
MRIAQTNASDTHLIAGHFFQRTVGVQNDVAVLHFIHQTLNKDFFRAETVTAVNQMHFRSDVRQIQRLFNRGIAAADDRNFLVAIEETVAGCTSRNPTAFKGFFRGQAEIACRSSGGNNQRVASVFAVIAIQTERTVLQIHLVDMIKNDLSFKLGGMFVHALH